jgi:hypothetical protein
MHKYKEQIVPCGGTDAQGISGSIHTRYLVCMFDVVVRSRRRQICLCSQKMGRGWAIRNTSVVLLS